MPCDGPHRARQTDCSDRDGQKQHAHAARRGLTVNGRLPEILPPRLLVPDSFLGREGQAQPFLDGSPSFPASGK